MPREAYYKRTDLQLSGRTVMGMDAPRGQEPSDHYNQNPHPDPDPNPKPDPNPPS